MDHRSFSQLLQELIIAIDPTSMNRDAMYQTATPYLEKISDLLRVAKIETAIHIDPNAHFPEGSVRHRNMDFAHEPGPVEDAITLKSGRGA